MSKSNDILLIPRRLRWGYGALLSSLFLAVNVFAGLPPVINVQPTNQTVLSGNNVSFVVSATSATAMSYQWYFNGVVINGATNATYTKTGTQFTNAGPYYVAVKNAYGTVNSSTAKLNVNPPSGSTLSAPWLTADIGVAGLIGSAFNFSNIFTVNGAGSSMSGVTADNFRFVYQTMVGDGSIVARVTSQSGTNVNGNAGIMIRETTATGSRYMAAVRQGNGAVISRSRPSTSGATASVTGSTYGLPNCWLKLVRTGNSITASASTNGTTWVALQTNTITMATNIIFGLIATSGTTNVLDSDKFDNITVVP